CADRPAGLGRAADRVVGEVRPNVAKGGAGSAVNKEPIERVACAAAHGAEPSVLCQAAARAEAGGRNGTESASVGPVAISLNAEHERSDLVVGPYRSAEDKTGRAEIAGRATSQAVGPTAGAEGEAAVEAEIDAGPICSRRFSLGPGDRRWFRNQ